VEAEEKRRVELKNREIKEDSNHGINTSKCSGCVSRRCWIAWRKRKKVEPSWPVIAFF